MKKSILNLGKALNRAQQKEINGGVSDHDAPVPEDDGGGVCSNSCHSFFCQLIC